MNDEPTAPLFPTPPPRRQNMFVRRWNAIYQPILTEYRTYSLPLKILFLTGIIVGGLGLFCALPTFALGAILPPAPTPTENLAAHATTPKVTHAVRPTATATTKATAAPTATTTPLLTATATAVPSPTSTATATATATAAPPPTATATASPTAIAMSQPTALPTSRPAPTATPKPQPTLCPGVNCNPWGYNFSPGNLIYNPPDNFCGQYFTCIGNFSNGSGYVIECHDGEYSKSGGLRGSCSHHGGDWRPLYSH